MIKVLAAVAGANFVYLAHGTEAEIKTKRDILLRCTTSYALKILTAELSVISDLAYNAARFDEYCKRTLNA